MDVIACSTNWFLKRSVEQGFDLESFRVVTEKNQLDGDLIESEKPDYVFFPHWNWKVPESIYGRVESIVFHTGPLPAGRGGSPIQNLILNGFEVSPINSLQMTNQLDAGPIYFSDDLDLSGTLDEIFARATPLVWKHIELIRELRPKPEPQSGEASYFRRLSPADNEIMGDEGFEMVWNKLRMVESDGYPDAFSQLGDMKVSFTNVSRDGIVISGNFKMVPIAQEENGE